ncbi:MAG: hypothetical protein CMH83_01840 [Nocardioides sp.]|nr:hypothetical protein [Nocardioides sp.]
MDWLGDNLWSLWLGAAIVLGAAEMFSFDLVLIMLAVGAVAGMVSALLGAPLVLQALLAAGASVAMLALVRPGIVKKLHGGPELRLGTDRLVGLRGVVLTQVTGLAPGRIKLDGEEWTAAPYDEHTVIAPGQTVEVLQIRGATAYVHPVPELDP